MKITQHDPAMVEDIYHTQGAAGTWLLYAEHWQAIRRTDVVSATFYSHEVKLTHHIGHGEQGNHD